MTHPDTIKRYVIKTFPSFGVNKTQQISRLLFEISKREGVSLARTIKHIPTGPLRFATIKKYLISRRFPETTAAGGEPVHYLPQLDINPQHRVNVKSPGISPKNIYVEEKVSKGYLSGRFKKVFPKAKFITIRSLKEYMRKHRRSGLDDYNKRSDSLFIIREKFDFFKPCPCTPGAWACGYNIFNLGFGCIYECTYCFLQEYTNSPGIIIPANIEDFFSAFKRYRPVKRLGTGEFTDSLALDHITEFSPLLVEFFKKYPRCAFELKTKSANIEKLISSAPAKNVVIAWSLNPQRIIDTDEFYTAPLSKRFKAARQCIDAGFTVGFHFDPIIYYKGWGKDYENVVNMLFDKIDDKYISWVSLGTLRFSRPLKKIIENRFPQTRILDGELFPGFDGKMRYRDKVRADIYRKMNTWIKKRSKRVFIYLCMENARDIA